MDKNLFFTVKLQPAEMQALDDLAKATDRRRSEVFRRLLALANTPQGRRLLGEPAKAAKNEPIKA